MLNYLFEIHTPDKMYTIEAHHFTVIKSGVMFFNDRNEGIGFVPNGSLDLLRMSVKSEKEYKLESMMRGDMGLDKWK